MFNIFILLLLVGTFVLEIVTKKKAGGQVSQESLTGKEKAIIWFLCIFQPVWCGAILYYGWKNKLPVKAKQANNISLWAFLILILLGAGLFVMFPNMLSR